MRTYQSKTLFGSLELKLFFKVLFGQYWRPKCSSGKCLFQNHRNYTSMNIFKKTLGRLWNAKYKHFNQKLIEIEILISFNWLDEYMNFRHFLFSATQKANFSLAKNLRVYFHEISGTRDVFVSSGLLSLGFGIFLS